MSIPFSLMILGFFQITRFTIREFQQEERRRLEARLQTSLPFDVHTWAPKRIF